MLISNFFSFLLVEINVGPCDCLLLNKAEENDVVAVCNLTLKSSKEKYVIATASLHTIVTKYPQYNFLQKKIEELEQGNLNVSIDFIF